MKRNIEEWKSNFSAYENRIGTLRDIEDFKFIKANKDHYLAMLEHAGKSIESVAQVEDGARVADHSGEISNLARATQQLTMDLNAMVLG